MANRVRTESESYSVGGGRRSWVREAMTTPQPSVIAIYTAALSHADANRLADVLKREGFPGQVVVWVGENPRPTGDTYAKSR